MKDTPANRRQRADELHERIRAIADPAAAAPEESAPAASSVESPGAFVQRRMVELNRTPAAAAATTKKKTPRASSRGDT